jgi:hypothetical protein
MHQCIISQYSPALHRGCTLQGKDTWCCADNLNLKRIRKAQVCNTDMLTAIYCCNTTS